MISSILLQEMAQHINRRIAKVVLNQSVEITDFQIKDVSEQEVLMEYIIPAGAAETVTLIELQDEAGTVLTTNPVYIPLTTDTLIKHPIAIKEVA